MATTGSTKTDTVTAAASTANDEAKSPTKKGGAPAGGAPQLKSILKKQSTVGAEAEKRLKEVPEPTAEEKKEAGDDIRKDQNGNTIGSKTEKFKLTYRDKVKSGSALTDVYHVESYKKYNATEYEEETIICKCSIF